MESVASVCSGGQLIFCRMPIGSTMMMMVMRHIKYENNRVASRIGISVRYRSVFRYWTKIR
jgi:hypothetical protein